jgi:hypothetical protein
LDPRKAKDLFASLQKKLDESTRRRLTMDYRRGATVVTLGPSAALIRAQVQSIREKARREDPRVFGFRSEGGWSGTPTLEIDGDSFVVAPCRSTLEVRERLARSEDDGQRLIVITALSESELGEDVVARLARRRLAAIDPWEGVVRLFQASKVDPRLRREGWMANALIESAPPGGYPAVPAGVLDRDTAWTAFFVHRLGLPDGRPDPVALLRWSLDPRQTPRFESLDTAARQGVRQRLRETAGIVGSAVVDCLEAGNGLLAVPIGLALGVVFADNVSPEDTITLRQAAVRVERFLGGMPIAPDVGAQWKTAAELVLRETPDARLRSDVMARADTVLEHLGVATFAYVSDWSPAGFQQRLARFAAALHDALDRGILGDVWSRLQTVSRHQLAVAHSDQVRRAEMAARLVRWLLSPVMPPSDSLANAARAYAQSSSLVDLARIALRAGDAVQPLAVTYASVLSEVADRRETENRRFGELLVDWIATGSTSGDVLPVEQVIERVIGPLAVEAPVLLVVVDGMSVPVWRDILEDLSRQGWAPLSPVDAPIAPGIATVPSVTQYSRTSLLSGRLTSGAASDEKRAFEAHPSLVQVSKTQFPPVLFHKGELSQPGGRALSEAVRSEIASPDRRIVAAVVNAVDDYLAKADQVRPRWSLEYLPLVAALLHEARMAGRVVVFASDHGHMLDDETQISRNEYGDRWRGNDQKLEEGEIVLAGPRVAANGGRVIVPWSERTRYGMRKNGYHGGATLQEMIVPIAVVSAGMQINGWIERSPVYPQWWEEPDAAPQTAIQLPAPQPLAPARKGRTAPLFEQLELARVPAGPSWIDLLIRSEVFASQKKLAGRVAPPDDQFKSLLVALEERGGKLTRATLAHRLGLPLVRVAAFIAAARRVLNVEGYAVVRFDETTDAIELNRELLLAQFELESSADGRTQ